MTNDEKDLGAVSATEVDAASCLVPAPELSRAEMLDRLRLLAKQQACFGGLTRTETPHMTYTPRELAQALYGALYALEQPQPTAWAYEQAYKARNKWHRRAQELLEMVQALASEGYRHLDADRDMKAGKILSALAGVRGMRPDLDALYAEIIYNKAQVGSGTQVSNAERAE